MEKCPQNRGVRLTLAATSLGVVVGVVLGLWSLTVAPGLDGSPWVLNYGPWVFAFPHSFFFGHMNRTVFLWLMFIQYPVYGLVLRLLSDRRAKARRGCFSARRRHTRLTSKVLPADRRFCRELPEGGVRRHAGHPFRRCAEPLVGTDAPGVGLTSHRKGFTPVATFLFVSIRVQFVAARSA